MIRLIPLIVVTVALAAALAAEDETTDAVSEKVQRPTTAVAPENCVTGECHATVKQHKIIHGPVNVDACDACHKLVDPKKHSYEPARAEAELCTFCHKLDMEQAKVVHKPLEDGQCLGCHAPHGGFDRSMLRGQSMSELCNECHQPVAGKKKSVHGPVAAGACAACHAPHSSDHPKLLAATGRDLCLGCHKEMRQQIKTTRFKHQPVEDDCTQCHDAHASDHAMMIREQPLKLCTESCHEDIRKAVEAVKHKHSAVTKDKACINCHTSHGGDLDHLLVERPIKLCLQCHDRAIEINDDHTVPAVAEVADDKLVKHGPAVDGECGGCHNVHGSAVSRLLAKPYPEKFYTAFKLEKYDLCFECHEKQLVLLEKTEGLTGFRNGAVNLHYMHVNKAKRGRVCRACHSTHASPNKVHIRETVPYGNWQLPINFKPTATGGSCAPGCHQAMGYDRQQPADNSIGGNEAKD